MKTTYILEAALLLASPLTALTVGTGAETGPANNKLEKRTGHMDVHAWSDTKCGQTAQGTSQVGTGGVCVNLSNAGSIGVGGPSAKNPGGCSYVFAQWHKETGCKSPTGYSATYPPHTCQGLPPQHGSALMRCVKN